MLESRTKRPKKKPTGQYHHGDLRHALVQATLAIVEREGTGAVSLSAAARRVGVSPQASYNHFRDKGELLAVAAEEAIREVTHEMRAARETETRPGERLEATGIAYVRFAQRNVAKFRLLAAPELADKKSFPGLVAAYEDAFAVLVACVDECQQAGLIRKDGARKLAVAAWATVHGAASLAAEGLLAATHIEGDPVDVTRDSMRALFKGLRTPK